MIVGLNGTGKTTIEKELVKHFLSKNHRALIITPYSDEWTEYPKIEDTPEQLKSFRQAARIVATPENGDELIMSLYYNYKNGLLVLDDMRIFVDSRVSKYLENIMVDRRHRKVDVIAVAHSFETIPKAFYRYGNIIFLFKTSGKINDRKRELVNPEEFERAQVEVNQAAETNPHFFKIINL
jgi:Cdc6-like AAA superfamily ATPase